MNTAIWILLILVTTAGAAVSGWQVRGTYDQEEIQRIRLDSPLVDLDVIQARLDAATPGQWYAEPHDHLARGCRCGSCTDPATGWLIDNDRTHACYEGAANDMNTCDQGPLLTFADAAFLANAYRDITLLLGELRRRNAAAALGIELDA